MTCSMCRGSLEEVSSSSARNWRSADVVTRAIEMSGPLLEQRSHRLHVDVPRGWHVDGDPTRLGQVISNLLTNAAKYTPPGGESGSGGAGRRPPAVSVRDSGIGIAPEMLPHVFDLFVQERQAVERSQGGLGHRSHDRPPHCGAARRVRLRAERRRRDRQRIRRPLAGGHDRARGHAAIGAGRIRRSIAQRGYLDAGASLESRARRRRPPSMKCRRRARADPAG